MRRRSQVSMEYMLVVGFTLLLIVPILVLYGREKEAINNQVSMRQAENIARKIADSAETVYYIGKPAKTTLKVYMPQRVHSATVANNEIYFTINYGKLLADTPAAYCSVNVTGNISTKPGIQYIEIAADDNVVNITTRQT